ncbi:hypothetical protein BH11MYX1_BH11MYX1_28010 [soil metagenome]
MTETPSLRPRGNGLPILVVAVMLLFTFANFIANLMPSHHPTRAARQREEQREVVAQRHVRLAELLAGGDHCQPAIAHELARTLVFDGTSARAYAVDYEQRCGLDPVVHDWGAALLPHELSARSSR